MPLELPKEVWVDIFKRLTSVSDWGRLQQVSRLFNIIIRAECWVQVKELKYSVVESHPELEINQQKFLLSKDKLMLLLEEMGQKATKIQSISLELAKSAMFCQRHREQHWDRRSHRRDLVEPSFFGGILERLASMSLKVQDLTLKDCFTETVSGAMGDFIRSISGTLKNLKLECWWSQPASAPQLLLSFKQCRTLETIDILINYDDYWPQADHWALIHSVLFGANQLKTFKLSLPLPAIEYNSSCSALLNTGAHLSIAHLQAKLLKAYGLMIQKHNLAATNHPLKSLKTLTVIGGWMSFELFPQLQQLIIGSVRPEVVNGVVSGFLSQYRDFPGQSRLLLLEVDKILGYSTLEAVSSAMDWPVSWAEEMETSMEFQFIRGNAAIKLIVQRN